jgi:hypothetical protein
MEFIVTGRANDALIRIKTFPSNLTQTFSMFARSSPAFCPLKLS